jgi:hypothetical protein
MHKRRFGKFGKKELNENQIKMNELNTLAQTKAASHSDVQKTSKPKKK